MTTHGGEVRRILVIDPTSRGFGFTVLEGPESLIYWGVKHAPRASNAWCLQQVGALIDFYHLDFVVVEAGEAKGSRRSARVRELLRSIRELARRRKVEVRAVPRRAVRKAFGLAGASTKHQIATVIAGAFRALAPRLPPKRKPWMGEYERMAIFNAVSLGVTFFHSQGTRTFLS